MKRYQFSISGLLKLTTFAAVVFAVLRLLPASLLLGVVVSAALTAIGLAVCFLYVVFVVGLVSLLVFLRDGLLALVERIRRPKRRLVGLHDQAPLQSPLEPGGCDARLSGS